jgi:hypothetical protein
MKKVTCSWMVSLASSLALGQVDADSFGYSAGTNINGQVWWLRQG